MKTIALVLSLAGTFALSFELACRIEDRIRYGMPMFSAIRDEDDLIVRDQAGMHGRPGARFQNFSLNSLGMRGPEVRLAKATTTLRVVTVGASETFGLYESPGHEYPRQLEAMLNARLAQSCAPARGRRVEVINAAIFGMSLPTAEQDLRLRVAPTHPDVIVAYPTPPHYLEEEMPRASRPDSARKAPPPLAQRLHPRAIGRLREQVKALLPSPIADWMRRRQTERAVQRHAAGWRWTSVPNDRLAAYESDLRRLVGTMRAIGGIPLLMTHANAFSPSTPRDAALLARWERFYQRATGATIVAFDSVARDVTMRVAADSGVTVIDAQHALYERAAAGDRPFFADYAHFTDAGATQMASLIADSIPAQWHAHNTSTCRATPSVVVAGEPRDEGKSR